MPIAGGAVFQCRTLVWVVRNIPQKNRHYTHQWTRLNCETNLVSSVGRVISSSEYRVMNSCVDRVSSSSGVRVFRANAKAARSKRRWPPLLIFRYPTLGFQGRFSLPVPVAKPDAPNPRSRRSSYRIASGIPGEANLGGELELGLRRDPRRRHRQRGRHAGSRGGTAPAGAGRRGLGVGRLVFLPGVEPGRVQRNDRASRTVQHQACIVG